MTLLPNTQVVRALRPVLALTLLSLVGIPLVEREVPAATPYACGDGPANDAAKKCDCVQGKVEATDATGVSRCVEAKPPPPPAVTASATAPASKPAASSTSTAATTSLTCPSGMAAIPGGAFTMGQRGDAVTVQAYCLDVTEVTVRAFGTCVTGGACTEPTPYAKSADHQPDEQLCNWKHPEGRALHPINCVDWSQSDAYCRAQDKRLPTEEEWEWAARSGDKAWAYPWGGPAPDPDHVNACGKECPPNAKAKGLGIWQAVYAGADGFPETAPVGSFSKGDNVWGVHDLSGNVWEWTDSKWVYGYPYDAYPDFTSRVFRGGGMYFFVASWLSASTRARGTPERRLFYLGFRCARTPG